MLDQLKNSPFSSYVPGQPYDYTLSNPSVEGRSEFEDSGWLGQGREAFSHLVLPVLQNFISGTQDSAATVARPHLPSLERGQVGAPWTGFREMGRTGCGVHAWDIVPSLNTLLSC